MPADVTAPDPSSDHRMSWPQVGHVNFTGSPGMQPRSATTRVTSARETGPRPMYLGELPDGPSENERALSLRLDIGASGVAATKRKPARSAPTRILGR